jgi:cell division septal protein FtsQ
LSKGRRALKIVSFVVLFCVLAFVAYQLFQIRRITVNGCETLKEENIISLTGLEYGQSIFTVDTQQIMETMDTEPNIKPVSVNIEYPDGIVITIKQRKEAACIKKENALLIIDDECYLLKVLMQPDVVPYPLVHGLQADAFKVGERVGVKDIYQLDVLSSVLVEAKNSGISLLSIDVSLAANVVLETKDGYTVEIGDDTRLSNKFSLVKSVIKKIKEMGKTEGILNVASAANVYYREN